MHREGQKGAPEKLLVYGGVVGGRTILALAAVAALSAPAHADPRRGWKVAGIPVANYDADAGFGLGAIGALEYHTPGVRPYRAALVLQLFVTSELMQAHEIRWDILQVGHRRLRLFGRVPYFATVNRHYCGAGNEVTCDPAAAESAAAAAGLSPGTDAWSDFVRRYYRRRFLAPGVQAGARWRLDDSGRLSAFGQWRVAYYRSGTLTTRGEYPGSLYDEHFPGGEDGVASVPQLGLMYDTRDSEPTPTRGVWLEASVRGAGRPTGSRWSFAGANAVARLYRRVSGSVISATRLVADVAAGAMPIEELALVNSAETYSAFGGAAFGRGVRDHRYVGRIKLLAQQELRVRLPGRWVAVGFVDAGWIALDWDDPGDPTRVLVSGGAGARWVKSPGFILRADVGVSPIEGWSPQAYLYLGHLF